MRIGRADRIEGRHIVSEIREVKRKKQMSMNKKIFGTMLAAVLYMSTTQAQDIHFSQFYENGILRNPALTGIFSGDYKAGVNYRTQWSSISVPFQTMLATAEDRKSTRLNSSH